MPRENLSEEKQEIPKRRKRTKGMKNQPILDKPSRMVGDIEVKSWQRMPRQLLTQQCQKQNRPKPRFLKPRVCSNDPSSFKAVVILPSANEKEQDTRIGPSRAAPSEKLAEECAALEALGVIAPSIPFERQVPEYFGSIWLDVQTKRKELEARIIHHQESAPMQKKKKDSSSKLAKLHMHENTRRYISEVLRSFGNESIEPENDGIKDSRDKKVLTSQLIRKGFSIDDIEMAIKSTAASSENEILDWLLFHIPEHKLPKRFHPDLKQVQVILSGSLKLEAGDEEVLLTRCGFPKLYVQHCLEKSVTNVVELAFIELYEFLAPGLFERPTSTEDCFVFQDEMMALEAIFESNFDLNGDQSWSILLEKVKIDVNTFVPIEIQFASWTILSNSYPAYPPMIYLISSSQEFTPDMAMMLLQGLIRFLVENSLFGIPLTHEVVEWVKQNAYAMLQKSSLLFPLHWLGKQVSFNNERPKAFSGVSKSNQKKKIPQLYRDKNIDIALRQRFEKHCSLDGYQKMLHLRQQLPIFAFKQKIVKLIQSNQVSILCAATGAGKSTQVGQFIVDDMVLGENGSLCRILCTQPRRISAIGLCERVCTERDEKPGRSIGYSVRLESKYSKDTKLLFLTTGILVKMMTEDPLISDVSHVLIDEVHERSVHIDLILLMLKQVVFSGKRPDLKIVLMSATLDADFFSDYFGSAPSLSVPGRTFPVELHHLERFLDYSEFSFPRIRREFRLTLTAKDSKSREEALHQYCPSPRVVDNLLYLDESNLDPQLIAATVFSIIDRFDLLGEKNDRAILIFVPGIADIIAVKDAICVLISSIGIDFDMFWLLALHSSLSSQEQQRVFTIPPEGVLKIIVSTNIAETSVTVPDVVYVVDSGRMNQTEYDPLRNTSSLVETWISKANAKQRMGRAGRVSAGHCFRMYTSARYKSMLEFQLPEILRIPLESVCLQSKLLAAGLSKKKPIPLQKLLHSAISPPKSANIKTAVDFLKQIGSLDSDENVTPLGKLLAQLPVTDIRIGKMLAFAAVFRCVTPIVVVAALISERSPFISSIDDREEANAARMRFKCGLSDHLTVAMAFNEWYAVKSGKRSTTIRSFCSENFISNKGMQTALSLMKQYVRALQNAGLLSVLGDCQKGPDIDFFNGPQLDELGFDLDDLSTHLEVPPIYDAYSSNMTLVRCLLTAGLYPNVIRVKLPGETYSKTAGGTIAKSADVKDIKFYTREERVFIHPASALFSQSKYSNPWMVYLEKRETSKVFIRDCSVVSAYSLVLFGGPIEVQHDLHRIKVDNWITFEAPAKIAVIVKKLRELFDYVLTDVFEHPGELSRNFEILDAIVTLLVSDGDDYRKRLY